MTKISDVISWFDQVAPRSLAAGWDNTGLLMGDWAIGVSKILFCLTLTNDVADEAVNLKAQLVVTHHPLPFKPIKSLNTGDLDGAILWKLANNGISVFSLHTRWDDAPEGINELLLKIASCRIMGPIVSSQGSEEMKLVTFVPKDGLEKVSAALFDAGAGHIGNYKECSFVLEGTGTFFGNDQSSPVVGEKGRRENVAEQRLEVVCPVSKTHQIVSALKAAHPYEEPAYDLVLLKSKPTGIGTGRIGLLQQPTSIAQLAGIFKSELGINKVVFAGNAHALISRIAVVCGSGASLMSQAFTQGAECFVTGEARFHDLVSAKEQGKAILLLGHYKSERFGMESLAEKVRMKFPKVEVVASKSETDPQIYF